MEKSFVYGVAVTDYNFTGRVEESRRLKLNFENGINSILISPRRWGKTSLVCRPLSVIRTTFSIYRRSATARSTLVACHSKNSTPGQW